MSSQEESNSPTVLRTRKPLMRTVNIQMNITYLFNVFYQHPSKTSVNFLFYFLESSSFLMISRGIKKTFVENWFVTLYSSL